MSWGVEGVGAESRGMEHGMLTPLPEPVYGARHAITMLGAACDATVAAVWAESARTTGGSAPLHSTIDANEACG